MPMFICHCLNFSVDAEAVTAHLVSCHITPAYAAHPLCVSPLLRA